MAYLVGGTEFPEEISDRGENVVIVRRHNNVRNVPGVGVRLQQQFLPVVQGVGSYGQPVFLMANYHLGDGLWLAPVIRTYTIIHDLTTLDIQQCRAQGAPYSQSFLWPSTTLAWAVAHTGNSHLYNQTRLDYTG